MLALLLAPLYILINFYVVRWIIWWMGACHQLFRTLFFRVSFVSIYVLLATALLTGFLIKKPLPLRRALKHTGNYFLGTFLYILMGTAVFDLGRLVLKYFLHMPFTDSSYTFVIAGSVCAFLILGLSFYGIFHAKKIKTVSYQITIPKAAENTSSLKVVLLADTHFGCSVGRKQAKRIVEQINQEKPDLVCIAGDIFDNEFDAISHPEELAEILKKIKSKYGVFACWGNHDLNEPILAGFTFGKSHPHYEDPRMDSFLSQAGIRLLDDEAVLLDNKFYLIGRRDYSRCKKVNGSRKTPAQLTEKLNRSKPILMMDHQPKELTEIAESGVDLDLCGHTHDGQIFPANLVTHFSWENSCGYLKKGNLHNIVTAGAGIWGPNMRIGTSSEICSVTIHFSDC